MTFSVVARDARTGQIGVGAVTAMVGVGKLVPHARSRVGAVATQAMVNPYLAFDALDRLADGCGAREALDDVIAADPGRDFRQCGVLDASGRTAAWTGPRTPPWSGHLHGSDFAVQGNRLVGPQTLEAMVGAFRAAQDTELAWRIFRALQAGEETGADKDGALSATVTVMDTEAYPLWDLRVDHADDPVAALGALMEEFERQLLPTVRKLSTREDPEGQLTREHGRSIA